MRTRVTVSIRVGKVSEVELSCLGDRQTHGVNVFLIDMHDVGASFPAVLAGAHVDSRDLECGCFDEGCGAVAYEDAAALGQAFEYTHEIVSSQM